MNPSNLKKAFFVLASVLLLNTAFVNNTTTYANRSEAFIASDSTGLKYAYPTITITQSRIKISNDQSDTTTVTKLYSTQGGTTYTFTPGEYDITPGEYGHLIGGDYVAGSRNVHSYLEYN